MRWGGDGYSFESARSLSLQGTSGILLAVGALEDPTLDGAFELLVRRMHGVQHNYNMA